MPKYKTRKSLKKRIKVTASGKLLRGRSFTSHLRVKKSSRQKRRLKGTTEITGFHAKKFAKALRLKKK